MAYFLTFLLGVLSSLLLYLIARFSNAAQGVIKRLIAAILRLLIGSHFFLYLLYPMLLEQYKPSDWAYDSGLGMIILAVIGVFSCLIFKSEFNKFFST